MRLAARSQHEDAGLVAVADEEERFGARAPGGPRVRRLQHVVEPRGIRELAVRTGEAPRRTGEIADMRQVAQPVERGRRERRAVPRHGGGGKGGKVLHGEPSRHGIVVVARKAHMRPAVDELKRRDRIGTVSEYVTEANDLLRTRIGGIRENRPERGLVRMDVRDDRVAHGEPPSRARCRARRCQRRAPRRCGQARAAARRSRSPRSRRSWRRSARP